MQSDYHRVVDQPKVISTPNSELPTPNWMNSELPTPNLNHSFGFTKSAMYSCVGERPSRLLVHITLL